MGKIFSTLVVFMLLMAMIASLYIGYSGGKQAGKRETEHMFTHAIIAANSTYADPWMH